MKEFILSSNVFLAGLKSTSKNSVRKYFTDLGLKSHNVETSNNIAEAIAPITEKLFKIVFIDDDAEDIKDFDSVLEVVHSKSPKKDNRLLVLLANKENQAIIDEFYAKGGDLHIQKPYTMEAFQKAIESYFTEIKNEKKEEKKRVKKEKELTKKAQSAYKSFKEEFDIQKSEYDEKFQGACEEFLESLESQVDENALSNILNTGLEFKNYEALHLFVKAWIQIFPIQDEDVADVTRVLIYNKNFNLMNSISPKEQNAKVALGAGMVVAAMASQHESKNINDTVVSFIKKGLELSDYKNIITFKSLEILISLGAIEVATEIFNLEIVQEKLLKDQELYNIIKDKIS